MTIAWCHAACTTPPAAPNPPVERRIELDGGAVFVRTGGTGPDVFLLHGLGDTSVAWRKVEQCLRDAGYRVTVWDALGAGASDRGADADYGLDAHIERLAAVFDELGIDRAHVIGNSLGGSLALLAAQAHPERIAKLVLVNPAAYPEGGTTPDWLWKAPWLVELVLRGMGPARIARFALHLHYGNASRITPEDLRVYTEVAGRAGAIEGLILQQQQLLPAPRVLEAWVAGMSTIKASTLILWGDADRILPIEQAHRLAGDLPDAELIIVPGVGHVMQLEDPERFLVETLRFLR